MKFRSICCLFLVGALLMGLPLAVSAREVTAGEVQSLSPGDFSEPENLAGICITGAPDPAVGSLMLGSRILQPGDILTAEQVSQITFHPKDSQTDREASITYLPIYSDGVQSSAVMSIAVIGRQDQPPVAEDSTLETYRNLPNEAVLKVKDPEGKAMTYTVTRLPKRGTVVVREDGSFIYTPKKNKVGIDSFTYTATDAAGNISREATVTITILKPSEAAQYSDTAGKSCRFAAEWMKNTGIFISENVNGNGCFQPEKTVSRGDFLTMLVGALDLALEQDATYTGFSDDTPQWLKPYLAAAMRCGIMAGWPHGEEFGYDAPITGAEAALMLQNVLDLTVPTVTPEETVPAWAQMAISALEDHGITLDATASLTRGQAAELLYQVSQLADSAPGMLMLRSAR